MKRAALIAFLLVFVLQIFSQRWEHLYGLPYTNETFRKVIEFYDHGYLLSAGYGENNGNWLIKTDINGNILWEKILAWENSSLISGTPLQDSTGNIVVTGSVWIDNEHNWPSVVKLDSCGNKLWCRTFIDYEYDYGYFKDAVLLDNSDILALAHHESETQVDQIFLYYVTSGGDLLWKKSFASRLDHPLIHTRSCEDVYVFDNNYYISGRCYYPYPGNPSHSFRRPFFIGIDSLFNEKWILPFGINDSILGETKSVIPLNDSVYMGVGIIYAPEGGGTSLIPNSLLMFFNSSGEELGHNSITNSQIGPDIGGNYIFDVESIDDTLFLASARFGEEIDPNPFGEFVIDTSGQLYNFISRPNTWGRSDLVRTFDNKYAIGVQYESVYGDNDILFYKINKDLEQDTVYTGNYTYDSLCPDGIESGIIDISDCMIIVGTEETPGPADYYAGLSNIPIEAFPNPGTNSITFSLVNTENHSDIELHCYDTFGRNTHTETISPMQTQTTIDVSKWNAGMYVAVVTNGGKVVGQCRFVVR